MDNQAKGHGRAGVEEDIVVGGQPGSVDGPFFPFRDLEILGDGGYGEDALDFFVRLRGLVQKFLITPTKECASSVVDHTKRKESRRTEER